MTEISADQIKKLRQLTGAGLMDCKKALKEAKGDLDTAVEILRKQGMAGLKKRADRETKEGIIDSYVHVGGKIGVLVEVNCETDFVAKNEQFKKFAHEIAMQIAAASPAHVSQEQVPEEMVERERGIYRAQALEEGKPEKVIDKIVEGKLEKFYQDICLLEQPFIKDQEITVKQYLASVASKIGENIVIKRFVRLELGEID